MKKRILFVDDEENVLHGLRRMLRALRKDWEMEFVLSGEEAVQKLTNAPYDVVVTDMRMPGMGGAELLRLVRTIRPEAARVVLSGHSEYQAVLESVKPTHQFLSKPCKAENLVRIIERAGELQSMLQTDLRQVANRIQSLPALPAVYLELEKELAKTEPSLQAVGKLIGRDPGLSASLLKLVNSSFFGFFRSITTPGQAVNLLGTDIVRGLAKSVHLFHSFGPECGVVPLLGRMWEHSFNTGWMARHIVERERPDHKDMASTAFIAGLLHDVGKLVLAAELSSEYEDLLQRAEAGEASLLELENQTWSAGHPEVGAYLLGLWGEDDAIMQAVRFHHSPGRGEEEAFNAALAVHAAEWIEHKINGPENGPPRPDLDWELLERLNLSDSLEIWLDECQARLEQENT